MVNQISPIINNLQGNFSNICNTSLRTASPWAGHVVRVIKLIPQQMQQYPYVAIGIIAIAIVMVGIVSRILLNQIFKRRKEKNSRKEHLNENTNEETKDTLNVHPVRQEPDNRFLRIIKQTNEQVDEIKVDEIKNDQKNQEVENKKQELQFKEERKSVKGLIQEPQILSEPEEMKEFKQLQKAIQRVKNTKAKYKNKHKVIKEKKNKISNHPQEKYYHNLLLKIFLESSNDSQKYEKMLNPVFETTKGALKFLDFNVLVGLENDLRELCNIPLLVSSVLKQKFDQFFLEAKKELAYCEIKKLNSQFKEELKNFPKDKIIEEMNQIKEQEKWIKEVTTFSNLLQELQTKEENFNNGLNKIKQFIDELNAKPPPGLTEETFKKLNSIKEKCNPIYEESQKFLRKICLTDFENLYDIIEGFQELDFSVFIGVDFIIKEFEKIPVPEKKIVNTSLNKITKTKGGESLDLYLSTPVQHAPRYLLFIGNLIKEIGKPIQDVKEEKESNLKEMMNVLHSYLRHTIEQIDLSTPSL